MGIVLLKDIQQTSLRISPVGATRVHLTYLHVYALFNEMPFPITARKFVYAPRQALSQKFFRGGPNPPLATGLPHGDLSGVYVRHLGISNLYGP